MIRNAFVCLLLLIAGTPLVGQCPADSAKLDDASAKTVFGPMAETIFNVLHPVGHPVSQDSLEQALKTTVPFVESWAVTRSNSRLSSRLVDLELSRWDKQTSSGSDASGSTSITSKGSVASLFSFAVENGALTRSVSGTTLTFRTSPANVIAAMRKGGWIDAGPSVPAFDGSFESIAKRFSFFVAFDASRGNSGAGGNNGGGSGSSTVFTGDKQQLAGWGSRFEIINHRDPRDPKYSAAFQTLMQRAGVRVADRLNRAKIAQVKGFDAITQKLQTSINTHPDDESAILDDYKTADGAFRKSVCDAADSQPDAYREINGAADDVASFLVQEADLFNDIARSFTLAVEYNLTRQANTNGSLPPSMTVSTTSATLPDLSNINLVASKRFSDGPEWTANASFTWFQGLPAGSKSGRIRDARASAQLDIPLNEIRQIGKPTISVSGLFLSLFEEPLGQQVLVNTVPVSRRGNIGLVQGKLTIPTKSAVSIPVSVTWASRTELIRESDVRGNIGISLDLDKLFAKGETKQ